jgi:hypothetical protein
MVVEEREALTSLRSAAGAFAARLGRRLRRRLASRRRGPGTPAELVRRRYADLERRLARAGRPRLPGVTVRDHLAAVAMAVAAAVASAGTAAPGSAQAAPPQAAPPQDAQPQDAQPQDAPPQAVPPPLALAAELASVYELARYSAHTVDTTAARRFEALARGFGV